MLTERQNEMLKLIVEDYIDQARPIGSKAISKKFNCSPATIRNEMSGLEEMGLLEKTHTSSGRVPSEKGYRYYVDNLMEAKKMTGEDMLKLQQVFHNQQLALSDVISKSLQIISDVTNYATVVLGSTSHDNLLKKIEVIAYDDESIIVIIVTDKGHVEHKNIKLTDVSLDETKKIVDLINNLIVGTPIDEISSKLEYEIKPIIGKYVKQHEQLYNAFYNVFTDFTNTNFNVVGKNKFLDQPEFSNVEKIKNVFNKLDDQKLLREIKTEDDKNIKIYIGNESNIDEDVTVIKTKVKDGEIAIVGPKRMEYDRVVAMLEYIKENIER